MLVTVSRRKSATYDDNLGQAYTYDPAGNRNSSLAFGQSTSYIANNVNAYTVISGGGFQPPSPTYDAKGNTLSLPRANGTTHGLTWDSQDRLRTVTPSGSTAHSMVYDPLIRLVWSRRPDGANPPLDEIWSWSSWTLLAREVFQSSTLVETYRYTWGPDLSGSLEGAGGVGGLLAIERAEGNSSTWQIRYAHSDSNGNVLALSTASARYRYRPFGGTISSQDLDGSGWAVKNLHRFSTKSEIAGMGLLYYGYRFYDPQTGRWPSRDPIGERGGLNLYGFVGNDGVNRLDYLGLEKWITYKSEYGDTESGQPKTTSEIWGIINQNGVLRHSAEERSEPVNGIDLRIFGEVVQHGEVAKQADETPNDQGKCCIKLDVKHIVDSLTIYNGSLALVSGDNYLSVAAHEANHIQAGFKRIFQIVDDYNKQEKPCFPTAARAALVVIEKRDKIKNEITDAMNSEGAHDTDGGFGTPGAGTPGT